MREDLITILKEINPYEEITEDTKLIEEGILDSLSLVMLIDELEQRYGIQLMDRGIQAEDFESIQSIERLVKGYE